MNHLILEKRLKTQFCNSFFHENKQNATMSLFSVKIFYLALHLSIQIPSGSFLDEKRLLQVTG